MMKKIFILLTMAVVATTASAASYSLNIGTNEHGTIAFTVNGVAANYANEGDVVIVTITPATGYVVNKVSGQWYAAQANARTNTRGVSVLKDVSLTKVDGAENQWSFTMERANVEISSTYKKLIQSSWISLETTSYTYDGTAKEPSVSVKDGDTTLPSSAYSISYSNNIDASADATVTIDISAENNNYTGQASTTFTIGKATLTEVTLRDTLFTYAYTDITVTVASVKAGKMDVPTDGYTLSGGTQKEIGNYTATVTGKGNFEGTASVKYRIKEAEPQIDVEANETEDVNKEVEDVTMKMTVAENAAENVTTEVRTVTNEETGEEEQVTVTVIPVVLSDVNIPEQADASEAEKKGVTVIVPKEIVDGNVVYKVTSITASAFNSQEGSDTEVNKVILPETEEPLQIEEGAMKPDNVVVEVVAPLSLLDDYSLMESMKENFEANKISATVVPENTYWTFSSGVDCVLPEGLTAYKAIWEDGAPRIVRLDESDLQLKDGRRGIKANNGVLIACDIGNGDNAYEIVASPGNQNSGTTPATIDADSYSGNCLIPTIEATNYPAEKILILKDNTFHNVISNDSKVRPCKAVFSLVKAGQ